MYKIRVYNTDTKEVWWEYGFSKSIMKKVLEYSDNDNIEITWIFKLPFTLKIFKKCLTRYKKTDIIRL